MYTVSIDGRFVVELTNDSYIGSVNGLRYKFTLKELGLFIKNHEYWLTDEKCEVIIETV